MRYIVTLIMSLLAAYQAAYGAPSVGSKQISVAERLRQSRPLAVAHRGCWEFGPENSLKDLKACIDMGVDMVECDVRATKDGVIVVMHDETLDRTTNFSGTLKKYTYAEIKSASLREGSGGPHASLTNERIPLLAEELRGAKGRALLLLHVKEPLYDEIYAVVAAEGMQDYVAFLVEEPFDDPRLRKARFLGRSAYIPNIIGCSLAEHGVNCYADNDFGRAIKDYSPLNPAAYMPGSKDNAFLIKSAAAIKQRGVKLIWAADKEEGQDQDALWDSLLNLNVSLILTNHASELMTYLKAKHSQ